MQPGQTLLHYRLVEQIGEGGMGVVWKAEDTTLGRDVAIKLLPPGFAEDADRLARFEREAKVLASLAHPNIAAIYGLHHVEGTHFLAMELVTGDDLSTRVAAGPVPLDEALAIAGQIAEALEAAHEHGIVHRDLKPANVRVGEDGRVRVLDFGLAKAFEAGTASGHSPTLSPTVTSGGTAAGVILGTAAYMSPEQARGKPVDRQTDVWAFGCVLYELLTGRAAYSGETVTDVLTGILHRDPDWNALPAVPANVRRAIEGCLQKDKRERLRDVGDVGLMLRKADAPAAVAPGDAPARPATGWRTLALASLATLVVVLGLIAFVPLRPWGTGGGGAPQAKPAIVEGITQLTDLPGFQGSPSLSGDGEQLLFVAEDGGDTDIFLQRVGGENPVNLTEDYADDDFQPAFSPDRQQIAFASRREGGGIFLMGATGESPRQISDAGFDPAWSPDGTKIVYTTERVMDPYGRAGPAELWVIDLASLERRELNPIDAAGASWSPNGHRIAFWTHQATVEGQRDIWTMAADGTDPVAVMEDVATDWDPIWSPDGRWLYFISDRGGRPDVWRVPIEERTGRVMGAIEPVTSGTSYVHEASIAANGRDLAITVTREKGTIAVAEFDPVRERVVSTPKEIFTSSSSLYQMDVSKDGEWIAYRTTEPREMLYVMRTDGTARRKILDDEHRNRGPNWSPDGEWIAIYSNRSGIYNIWLVRANGTGLRQLSDFGDEHGTSFPFWSEDGERVMVWGTDEGQAVFEKFDLGSGGPEGVAAAGNPTSSKPAKLHVYSPSISPGERFVAGAMLDPQGEIAFGVYTLATDEVTFPTRGDGRHFRPFFDVAAWLDEKKVVFWDYELRKAMIWDIAKQEARELPGIPGPCEMRFRDGGRTLILNSFPTESDIWMLSLAD